MHSNRQGHWLQTASSRMFWPLDPRPEDVSIEDIAAHLSKICRFNGACRVFYSVAEHSVLVSREVERASPQHALWGLMHDAAEAYVGDMVRPLKLSMPEYRAAEAGVMRAICAHFGLPEQEPPEVKVADNRMLATEARDILGPPPAPWMDLGEPLPDLIGGWPPEVARCEFLARYHHLRGGHHGDVQGVSR